MQRKSNVYLCNFSGVKMKRWKGFFEDTFLECDAETEEQAQLIMKKKLLDRILNTDEPMMTVWNMEETTTEGTS